MSWEVYRKSKINKHTFADQDCEEFWVELLSMDKLPYGESKKFRNLDMESEEGVAQSEQILAKHIINWHITDPETDELLPVPTPEDSSPLDELPSEFIMVMFNWMTEDSEVAQSVP